MIDGEDGYHNRLTIDSTFLYPPRPPSFRSENTRRLGWMTQMTMTFVAIGSDVTVWRRLVAGQVTDDSIIDGNVDQMYSYT